MKTGIAASATNVIQSWLVEKPPWIDSMTSESRYSVEKTSADNPTTLVLVVRLERTGSSGTPTPEAGEAAGWIVALVCTAENLPERRSQIATLGRGKAAPSLKKFVRDDAGSAVWPAVICAETLRSRGEVAFSRLYSLRTAARFA